MKLNMAPGQLGILISSRASGTIVQCLHLATKARTPAGRMVSFPDHLGPVWKVDRDLPWEPMAGDDPMPGTVLIPYCPDKMLRPLLDRPGEDETITWAGKPEGIPA